MSIAIQSDSNPPSYDNNAANSLENAGEATSAHDLPAYSPPERTRPARRGPSRPEQRNFEYKLEKKGKPFLVLKLVAEASSSKNIPVFREGTPVRGDIRMDLDDADAIRSVVINVQGRFVNGVNPDEQLAFIDISRTLWSQKDGVPCNASSTTPNSLATLDIGAATPKFTGKLQGNYLWPFSIDLPKKISLGHGGKSFPLPHNFNESDTRLSITYEISLRVHRGKLKTNHSLWTEFKYIPLTKPPPFLPLKRLAYQEEIPLMGPTIDLEGWHSEDQVDIEGILFKNRTVKIKCTLFVSKPLSYTRGALIPLCMRLESDDTQALDLLSTPSSLNVVLRRSVKYKFPKQSGWRKLQQPTEDWPAAVWWPSTDGETAHETTGVNNVRYINGELHLKPGLKPTSKMPHFQIKYHLVLLPFDAPGFAYSGSEYDLLQEHLVEIVTSHAHGPRAVKFAPPRYDTDRLVAEDPFVAALLTSSGFV